MAQPSPFGKYQLLERVAVGGMAELYLGKITGDQGFEKLVAIKCILPQFCAQPEVVDAFIDEAKLAAFLQHENIVQIYDFGCMDDRYFMAMEYLFGKDLRQIIDRCAKTGVPLTLNQSLNIVSRVCSGLEYAHNLTDYRGQALHIVHRDISPQNIFITYSGLVKILDFGVAKAAGRSSCTQSGVIKGKAAYMSPEQATGKAVDKRSDIFALGILLYELVTGKRMFEGEPLQILEQVRHARYTPPESLVNGLPRPLCRIMERALAREPEDRYPDCGEMLADLEACVAALPERSDTRVLGRFVRKRFEKEMDAEDLALKDTMPHEHTVMTQTLRTAGHRLAGAAGPEATVTLVTGSEMRERSTRPGFLMVLVVFVACVFVALGVYVFQSGSPDTPIEGSRFTAYAIRHADQPPELEAQLRSRLKPGGEDEVVSPTIKQAAALLETDPQKAAQLLRWELEKTPNDPKLLFQLGMVHVQTQAYADAIEVFTRVIELAPNLSNAVFNIAYAYAEYGDYRKAEEYYLRIVDMAPDYLDEALFNLAVVQERLGKREMAIRQLDLAVQFNPHNIQAIDYLYRLKRKDRQSK